MSEWFSVIEITEALSQEGTIKAHKAKADLL